jgi:hypothetical protein
MALNKAKKKTWYFKTKFSLGVVVHAHLPVISVLERLGQKDHNYKASLDYIGRHRLKIKKSPSLNSILNDIFYPKGTHRSKEREWI